MAVLSSSAIKVIVRRTFLELVLDDAALGSSRGGRSRSFSGPATAGMPSIKEQKYSSFSITPSTVSECSSGSSQLSEISEVASVHTDEGAGGDVMEVLSSPNDSSGAKPQSRQQRVGPWDVANVAACDAQRWPTEWTTLVLKSFPEGCCQEDIVSMLNSQGLGNLFDFLYAPTNFRKLAMFGFCHVNFVSHQAALSAMKKLQTLSWAKFSGAKLEVQWSEPHQGLDVHIERYRNSPVMHCTVPETYKPILLCDGCRVSFPAPTKPVSPPRDWARAQRLRLTGHEQPEL